MEQAWEFVVNYLNDNALAVEITGIAVMLMLFVSMRNRLSPGSDGWVYFKPRSYNRGKRNMRTERREYYLNIAAHDFVDSVEERVAAGEFSRVEAAEIYRLLKHHFRLRTLFPNPERVKENLKKRLGKHIEPNFPDKKAKIRPTNLFDPTPKRVTL